MRSGLDAIGLVSSEERAAFVRAQGAKGAVNRRDPRFAELFTTVPDGADAAVAWQQAGEALVQECREALGGRLPDYVVSHAGETAFPRSFQLLAEGGTLTVLRRLQRLLVQLRRQAGRGVARGDAAPRPAARG